MLRPFPPESIDKFGCEVKTGNAVGFPFWTCSSRTAVSPTTTVSRSNRAVTVAATAECIDAKNNAIRSGNQLVSQRLTSPILEHPRTALLALVVLPINQRFFLGL